MPNYSNTPIMMTYLLDMSPPQDLRSNLIWLLQLVWGSHAGNEGLIRPQLDTLKRNQTMVKDLSKICVNL